MHRRQLLGTTALAAAGAAIRPTSVLAHPTVARSLLGMPPLAITGIETIVIRTPTDDVPHDEVIELPPVGVTTPGRGIWYRLDHSSPSRYRGYEQATLVRVTTSEGLVGWGECHAPTAPRMHQRIIGDLFAPILLGQDARNVEALWERMYTSERVRGYSTGAHLEAIAGIDLALWDILGKYAGVPVYQLLGGKYRSEIPTYATFSATYTGRDSGRPVTERAQEMTEAGYTVLKMALRRGPDSPEFAIVEQVARSIESKARLAVDSLGAFTLHEATAVGRQLDRIGRIAWFEDPLLPDDMPRYPLLARAVDTAICAGEALSNRFQFRDLLASRGVDMVNPDLCRAGGITECRRIAALADVFGVIWSPHISTGSAPYIAASIHLAVATPNAVMMEVYDGLKHLGPFGNVLLEEPLEMGPGYAQVPERPGLGIEFNPTELRKVTVA